MTLGREAGGTGERVHALESQVSLLVERGKVMS